MMNKQWWDAQGVMMYTEVNCMYYCSMEPTVEIYRESYEPVDEYFREIGFSEVIYVRARPKWYGRGLKR